MTLMSAPRLEAPIVTEESAILSASGFVDRDAVGGGGGALVVEDYFVEVGATVLSSHTPDLGGPWTLNTDTDWTSPATTLQVEAGLGTVAVVGGGSVKSSYYLPESGSADLDIILDIKFANDTSSQCYLFFRSILAQIEGYGFGWSNGDFFLRRWDAGSGNTLYTSVATYELPNTYRFRCQIIGDAIKVWEVDVEDTDTPTYEGTDATYEDPGYVHLYQNRVGAHNKASYLSITEL